MEFRNINTFLKVASTQNFSKAAEQLGYSQSAVTVQIRQLEKELGTPLFERIGKRVSLTERGEEFTAYANEIMRVTNQAKLFAKNKKELDGVLRIGGVESVCTALLPDLLIAFHEQYPKVNIVIGLTYLFIAHDLSMVRHISKKVGVMYLGSLVEFAETEELYEHTLHPYTKALMSAVPELDPAISKKKHPEMLKGDVPSPIDTPKGCKFASRCPHATNRCKEERPIFKDVGGNHFVACHLVG